MLTPDTIRAALAAFAGFHRDAAYVDQKRRHVEALLAQPDVAPVLAADATALRTVSDETLARVSPALWHMASVVVCLDAAPGLREVTHATYWEQRRRRTNASRAANAAKRALATTGLAERFPVGARCEVHAFGYWYAAEVIRHAARGGKVEVRYTTGTGTTRTKLVAGDLIR